MPSDGSPADRGSKRCRHDGRAEFQERRCGLDSRAITSTLGSARALPELLALQRRHGDHFDTFNIGAFWSRFKALARGELGGLSDRLAPVCEQTVRMLPELGARQVSNITHAFAKAGLIGAGPWESVWAALPEAALRSLGDGNPSANYEYAPIVQPRPMLVPKTLLKRRQLRYFGWWLESEPYWEWDSGSRELHWLPVDL